MVVIIFNLIELVTRISELATIQTYHLSKPATCTM